PRQAQAGVRSESRLRLSRRAHVPQAAARARSAAALHARRRARPHVEVVSGLRAPRAPNRLHLGGRAPRQARRVTPRTVLVYYPDAAEARAYAELLRPPRPSLIVRVSSTPEEAAAFIGDTEILYGWNFPTSLLSRATKLSWIQCMGAGVERFLGPALPRRVILTRAAGIFGPWMAEYTLGWCLWVTQRMEFFRAQQRQRRWVEVPPLRLHGTTLCLVGLGDIGRAIAR